MGKVQRGRKKIVEGAKKKLVKPNPQPNENGEQNPETGVGRAACEGPCELTIVRITGGGNGSAFGVPGKGRAPPRSPGKALFLSDVPESLLVENLPLYSRREMPFIQCDICGAHTVRANVSECGHKFCDTCALPHEVFRGIACPFCLKPFIHSRLALGEEFLVDLPVQCRCGLQGLLPKIKEHVAQKGGRCQNSKMSLRELLQAGMSAMRTRKWADRCRYLRKPNYLGRKEIQPPDDFTAYFNISRRNDALPHVYLDMKADELFLGRLYVELHKNVVPKTVARFIDLIKDPRGYKGAEVDFIVTEFLFQVQHLSGYGSAVKMPFPDENFELKHDRPGTVSMANFGPDTNQSGFCVTNRPMPWRDGCNVVIGYVISGMRIIQRICELGREDGSLLRRVRIADCGMIVEWLLPEVFDGYDIFDSS